MADASHRVHGMGTALEPATWPAITVHEAGRSLAISRRQGG
jgi:hypothetical protein